MRRFIEMYFTGLQIECRDDQPAATLAQCLLAECRFQRSAQGLDMVLGEADAAQRTSKPVTREDDRTQALVKAQDVCSRHAQPQAQGDNATGRGAGDQVKEMGNALAQRLLQQRQEGSGNNTLDATAVNREDSFHADTCVGKNSWPRSSCQAWIASALSGALHAA